MITFLSSPKPFQGIAKEHQYRAIRSWLASAVDSEVILYGNSAGIDEAGQDLGVRVQKEIACTEKGIPYFGAIADHAAQYGKYDFQVYLNCDILLSGIFAALQQINLEQFLLIGQRIDLDKEVFVDVLHPGWKEKLLRLANEGKAKLHGPSGIDYFAFKRGMWKNLPLIIIGRGGYDNALLAYCMRQRVPIVDGTFAVVALHQFHEYNHVDGGIKRVMQGADAMHNLALAGGTWSRPLVSDADYVLRNSLVVSYPCRGDRLRFIELKIRYEKSWVVLALAMRLIWRGLFFVGFFRVRQVSLQSLIRN